MKKKLCLLPILSLIAVKSVLPQAPDWSRVLQYTTYGVQSGNCVTTDDNFIYVAGSISGPVSFEGYDFISTGLQDMILIKVSNAGLIAWCKQISAQAGGTINPAAIKVAADQNIYIAGSFEGSMTVGGSTITSDSVHHDFFSKFDKDGNGVWAALLEDNGTGISKIATDSVGGSYLLSHTSKLLKFDGTGSLQWEQSYPSNTLQALAVYGSALYLGGNLIQESTSFGDYVLYSSKTLGTAFLVKADLDGVFNKALIDSTPLVSSKEGNYVTDGTFVDPVLGSRTISQVKTLTGSEENILTTSIGDLSLSEGFLQLTINPDNSVTIDGTVYSESTNVVATSMMENRYDPYNQEFYLNYEYTLADGTRTISEMLAKLPDYSLNGSTISDLTFDDNGSMFITGWYTTNLTLNQQTITHLVDSNYTFIAKSSTDFDFEWIKSSTSFSKYFFYDINNFRVFTDSNGKIYQLGWTRGDFTFGTVQVSPGNEYYMLSFNSAGEALEYVILQNSSTAKIAISPSGKLIGTGSLNYEGADFYGNLVIQTSDWTKISSGNQSGIVTVNHIKHDATGNTYAQSRVRGYCDIDGTVVTDNNFITVLTKHDVAGNLLWLSRIPNNGLIPGYGPCFTLNNNNDILTTGYFETSLAIGDRFFVNADGNNDGYVAKYRSDSSFVWAAQLITSGMFGINAVTSDIEGNVIISGNFDKELTILDHTVSSGEESGAFIIKLDSSGNYQWAKGFPLALVVYTAIASTDSTGNIFLAMDIMEPEDDTLTFGDISIPQLESEATVLAKFYPDGETEWARTYGAAIEDPYSSSWPVDIKSDTAGNSYVYGWCMNNATFGDTVLTNPLGGRFMYYLIKINSTGDLVWTEAISLRNIGLNYGDLLDIDKDGNVYAGGHFRDSINIDGNTYYPEGVRDFFITKFANDGAFQWIKTMQVSGTSDINALSVYKNDVLSIAGLAGQDSVLGDIGITRMGGTTSIIATLGNLAFLNISPDILTVEAQANSTGSININSNINWMAESDQSWLTMDKESGSGNDQVILLASANTLSSGRQAIVTVSGEGVIPQTVSVTQNGFTTGVIDYEVKENIKIFPNPSDGKCILEWDGFKGGNIHIAVTNTLGINVRESFLVNQPAILTYEIDLSDLTRGIYFIRLETNDLNHVRTIVLE